MANAITKFKQYIDLLDEVYARAALTSVLDSDMSGVRDGVNANEIVIPQMSMDGLADYDRNSGYVGGSVSITNKTMQFNYERGRKFAIDAMDNDETAGIAFGKLAGEFIRTQVAKELDAFRFSMYSSKASNKVQDSSLTTGASVISAISTGKTAMDNAEVNLENRYLFITPTLHQLVSDMDTTKSREVLNSFAGVIDVPQSRFYTAIDLYDGVSTGEEAGGYVKNSAGSDINFMIVEKSAVMQYQKHIVNKVIEPELNQDSDSWLFFYRAYGLADVYFNKMAGVYCSYK